MKNSLFAYISCMLSLGAIALSSNTFAVSINLYDQPSATAKTVGSVDVSTGVIPIYTPPKNSDWVKVANPNNGDVGWVKSADLSKAMGTSGGVTFTQKILNDNKGQHTYQVIQFGQPVKSSDKQHNAVVMQNLQQQEAAQQQMQKAIESMVNQVNSLYQQQWNAYHVGSGMPVIMPIVVIPQQPQTTPKSK